MAVALAMIENFIAPEYGLAIDSVVWPDGTPASSLVNAGVLVHPLTDSVVSGWSCVGRPAR